MTFNKLQHRLLTNNKMKLKTSMYRLNRKRKRDDAIAVEVVVVGRGLQPSRFFDLARARTCSYS